MIIYDVEQNSEAWYRCRMGMPTASAFDSIITPTGKPSSQADGYINLILAEEMLDSPIEGISTNPMERGKELEAEAADYYSLLNEVDLKTIGFVSNDAKTMGASPDRLIEGQKGLLQIKCPMQNALKAAAAAHIDFLITQTVDRKYYPQLQGELLVTGCPWVDVLSYYPGMKPVIARVMRDEAYLKTLSDLLKVFNEKLCAKREVLIDLGHLKPKVDPGRNLGAG